MVLGVEAARACVAERDGQTTQNGCVRREIALDSFFLSNSGRLIPIYDGLVWAPDKLLSTRGLMHQSRSNSLSPEQFMRLFLRSEREIFRYVAVLVPDPHDAQDVVQETAAALWKKIDQYDPARPFTAWACRFALLEARQYAKKHRRWTAGLDESLLDQLVQRRQDMSHSLDVRRDHLADCLERLPARQRQIVTDYYYERESVDGMAARLGRTSDAIYKVLQRARHALLDCVERKMSGEGTVT